MQYKLGLEWKLKAYLILLESIQTRSLWYIGDTIRKHTD